LDSVGVLRCGYDENTVQFQIRTASGSSTMLCRDSRVRCLGHRPPLVFCVTSGDDYCWCRSRLAIETFRNESMHLRRCSPSLKGSYELHRRPRGTADQGHTCQVIMTTNSWDQESDEVRHIAFFTEVLASLALLRFDLFMHKHNLAVYPKSRRKAPRMCSEQFYPCLARRCCSGP
jgi:hypothetical protein